MDYQVECKKRWLEREYIDRVVELPTLPSTDGHEWVHYEEYMEALLINCTPGRVGNLFIRFPPEKAEDNKLHVHPLSDRVITVIGGTGRFVAIHNGTQVTHDIVPGDRVWMPRKILHTFYAGKEGLLVESIHNPWIPLEDPDCLTYPY